MSIFGSTNSKFISGGNTVILTYSVLQPNWQIPTELMHTSIITGKRNWITLQDHSEFTVKVHLTREADPNAKLTEIITYKDDECTFSPHADFPAVKDYSGDPANFRMTVTPYFLPNSNYLDGCMVVFRSLVPTKILTSYLIAEDGVTIITEDDNEIIL